MQLRHWGSACDAGAEAAVLSLLGEARAHPEDTEQREDQHPAKPWTVLGEAFQTSDLRGEGVCSPAEHSGGACLLQQQGGFRGRPRVKECLYWG